MFSAEVLQQAEYSNYNSEVSVILEEKLHQAQFISSTPALGMREPKPSAYAAFLFLFYWKRLWIICTKISFHNFYIALYR